MTRRLKRRERCPARLALGCPEVAQNGPSKFCGEGLMLRAERTWRERYLRLTRVTPLIFFTQNGWCRLPTRGRGVSGSWWPWPRLCQGTTYAGTRWTTLGYLEKVRSQVLSLRHIILYIKRSLLFRVNFPLRIFGLEVSDDLFGDSVECRAQIALCFCIYALHANEIPRTDPLVQVDYVRVVDLDIGGE
jgi:hypothetical protein